MVMIGRLVLAIITLASAAGCGGHISIGSLQTIPALALTPVTSGLAGPTVITHAGNGSGRLFVVDIIVRIDQQGHGERVMRTVAGSVR